MNSPALKNVELLKSFVKNTLYKINDLEGIINNIISNGCSPERMEALIKVTQTIKSFASTCDLQNIVKLINTNFDHSFTHLRNSGTEYVNEEQKKELKSNLSLLKRMVFDLQPPGTETITTQDNSSKSNHSLLNTIGQLSIWSFDDILNSLENIEGFSALITESADKLDLYNSSIKIEIKSNLIKALENIFYIKSTINQKKALYGNTRVEFKEHKVKELLRNTNISNSLSKKMSHWTFSEIPDISIFCDKIIFSQMWNHLWKLLEEWQAPGANLSFNLSAKVFPSQSKESNYKNKLNLYIWTEPLNSEKFSPDQLSYSSSTPHPDLAQIFYNTTKISENIKAKITCSKTPLGNPLFCIELPCSDITEINHSGLKSAPNITKTRAKGILIVDDEKDLRTVLSLKINRMGYTVYTAANIQEANEVLNKNDISLVISDLFLQKESGLDLFKSLSSIRPDIAFVFISGADEDDVPGPIFDMLSKFSKAFLTKPVETKVLKATIDKILGSPYN